MQKLRKTKKFSENDELHYTQSRQEVFHNEIFAGKKKNTIEKNMHHICET